MRVLLVDDSGTMRQVHRRTIERLGVDEILEAEDGRQALQLMQTAKPDLVITDWNMPNMDGVEMVVAIRTKDKAIPIIMVSTEAEKSKVIEAINAGVSDYLIKPFRPETLTKKIRKLTGF